MGGTHKTLMAVTHRFQQGQLALRIQFRQHIVQQQESLAKAMSLETLQGNRMVLHYTAEQEALFNDQHKQRISDAITAFFQEPMSVDFQLAEQTRETPVNYRIRRAEERRIAAVRHLKQDPNVERLIEMFDGQLDELSVEPLEIE